MLKLMGGMHGGGNLSGDYELILLGIFSFPTQQGSVNKLLQLRQ
jgi:hypothetical protein